MAMRKMVKDETALQDYIKQVQIQLADATPEEIRVLIEGRKPDGSTPEGLTAGAGGSNDFDYREDPDGEVCPLHSHARRSNPRFAQDASHPVTPRIARRGLSYQEGEEKGLLFMAYCASLARQYEVVQRWVNGANSTGLSSSQSDLLCGPDQARGAVREVFWRAKNLKVVLPPIAAPFARLRWGLYLFVPAPAALKELAKEPEPIRDEAQVQRGEARLRELGAITDRERRRFEWKRIFEEVPEAGSAQANQADDVFAAIRARRDGIVEVDELLFVAGTEEAARRVLDGDREMPGHFSVSKYNERFKSNLGDELGDHYLGHDATGQDPQLHRDYEEESTRPNTRFAALESTAFNEARAHARKFLSTPGVYNQGVSDPNEDPARFSVAIRDLARVVVAELCHDWFDMPARTKDPRGLVESLERFLLVSRATFQALPNDHLTRTAQDPKGQKPELEGQYKHLEARGRIAQELKLDGYPERLLPTALLGAVIGFAPPTVGAITRILDQWIEEESLWRLRILDLDKPDALLQPIYDALGRTPSPPELYRTAARDVQLKELTVPKGAQVVVGLRSVYLDAKEPKEVWLFGGEHGGVQRLHEAPPHGCPARVAGAKVIAGVVSALLERKNLRRERRGVVSFDA
jgi:hypothetical protein